MTFVLMATLAQAEPIKRASQPALSPDGETVVFSWQNDLWKVSANGGEARRLTVNPAADLMPRWSPDGSRIAFISNRFGSNDVFSMKPDGSDIQRLTFDSSTETIFGFSPDSKMILGHTGAWGRANLFAVPTRGGDMVRLTGHPLEMQFYPTVSPNGQQVAYCGGGSAGNWRNAHKEGTDTAEIWIGDLGAPVRNCKNLTRDEHNDLFPMFSPDNTIVWVSNRSGEPNLWRMSSNGGNPKRLTQHNGGTLRWPNMAANGSAIVYEYDSELFVFNTKTNVSKKLEIEVPEDSALNPVQDLTLTTGATEIAVSPDSKRAVVVVRGELFLIPERGGTTRRLTRNVAQEFSPVWIDNKRILFVTGRNNRREMMTTDLEGNETPFLSSAGDVTMPVLSPDGKWIAYHRDDREIAVVSVDGGVSRTLAKGGFPGAYQNDASFSWSPDSKWIVFSDQTVRATSVTAVEVASGKSIVIARVAKGADRPRFLPNGRAVYYTSAEFGDSDVVIVDLLPPDINFAEDDLDAIDTERPKPGGVEVKIDPRGIEYRVRRLTNGNATAVLASPDSRAIWANVEGQLSAIPVSGGPATPIAGVTGGVGEMKLSSNNAKVYFVAGGKPQSIALANGTVAPINFSAQLTINRKAEELALFNEIWWAMDRIYYDPNHHGTNWRQIQADYRALVPYVFDRQDFYALMNEMIEELDSSHLSVVTPPGAPPQANETTAFIGVEWDWAKLMTGQGYYVASVLPLSPADHPAMQLKTGDQVISVDGVNLAGSTSFAELMKGKVGARVKFGVMRGGQKLVIAIRPTSPATSTALRYEEFVATRRAEVERLSGGKLTYFHIQGMNDPSTERLFREMRMFAEGKQGAIIDVRWNGGGNTANRILAALRVQPWLYRKFRSMPDLKITEEMFRGEAIEMPVALMTNQYSASNAEIFSEGFRQMKLGPIIGEATGGNVLTIGGTYGLWDGGAVQIPFIGINAVNGEPLERIGRRVDYDVRFDPNAWNEGRDNQIEVAVRELLKRIK